MSADRIARIHEIRQYGTTEDAENMALDILAKLPNPDRMRLGIFATGLSDDSDVGDGGISFQRQEVVNA